MTSAEIFEIIKNHLISEGATSENISLSLNKNDSSIYFFDTLSIKHKQGKENWIYFKSDFSKYFPHPEKLSFLKSVPNMARYKIHHLEDLGDLLSFVYKIYQFAYEKSMESQSFGCCSRYEACSDTLRCTHPDQVFASGCMYRKNLESGRIFYGKNKNM